MRDLSELQLVTLAEAQAGDLLWSLSANKTAHFRVDSEGTKFVVNLQPEANQDMSLESVPSTIVYYRRAASLQIRVNENAMKQVTPSRVETTCAFRHGGSYGLAIVSGYNQPIFVTSLGQVVDIDPTTYVMTFPSW